MRRIERVKGRSDDMLIIRGVNVFPVADRGGAGRRSSSSRRIMCWRCAGRDRLDELDVLVETRPSCRPARRQRTSRRWRSKAEHLIKAYVGVTATVRVSEPGTIERSQGKAKRVIDRRRARS